MAPTADPPQPGRDGSPASASAPHPGRWLTLANALTLVRLVLAPLCAAAVLGDEAVLAAVLFAVAVGTDLGDGRIARRRGEASVLGGKLDHSTDALFVSAGLAALAQRGVVPVALAPLVVLAFVQYALDSRVLAGQRLRASRLGRYNGILYFALLGTPILRDAMGLTWPSAALVMLLGWALVASTAVSMIDRGAAWLATRAARDSHDAGRPARSPR